MNPGEWMAIAVASGKILVVDDVGFNRVIIDKCLSPSGYQVEQASSGTEALRLLSRYRYDLVLTDLMMPEMDGLKLFEQVKSGKFFDDMGLMPAPPFILCTAHLTEDVIQTAIQFGFQDVISKPIDRDRLLQAVEKVMFGKAEPLDVTLSPEIANILRALEIRWGTSHGKILENLLSALAHSDVEGEAKTLSEFVDYLANRFRVDPTRTAIGTATPSSEDGTPSSS
jgi:CheY-like chemotaxis protein